MRRLIVALSLLGVSASAQVHMDHEQREPPRIPVADVVERQLAAPYLSEDEKRDLRIRHGVWTEADLDTPQRRATAALIAGVYDDPSLTDESVDVHDRAEAAYQRGEPELALDLLDELGTARAVRIRGESLLALGRFEAADEAVEPAVQRLLREQVADADELIELLRALLVRTRVRGADDPAGDYRDMMALIGRVRDTLDRASWRARLLEAQVLHAKDNSREAAAALQEALSLNQRSAKGWALLAEIQVDGFNVDAAEDIREGVLETARLFDDDAIGVGADLAAARGRLRINDPDGAETLISPILERYPEHRHARAMEAALAARRFDYARTNDLLRDYQDFAPGVSDAALAVGRTLSDARQYSEASDYLNRAAKLEPKRPEPMIQLGLLELQWGRDREAWDALELAAQLDPFNTRVQNSLTLIRELRTYETVESDHFIVRYRPGIDRVLAREMIPLLEEMHGRVTGDGPGGIRHQLSEKTLIELMPDHAWFSVRITGMPKLFTIAAATGRVIAMEAPKEGPGHQAGPYNWLRVVRHEYTHTVTLSRTRNRIPHWMTEAAAVYLEDAPRDFDRATLLATQLKAGGLFRMEDINLGFIRPRRPFDRPLAYAQGHWMYEYLIERFGEESPLELMDLFAEGVLQNEAFDSVLGESPEEFRENFLDWARAEVIEWGMALPEGVPSLGTLLLRESVRRAEAERKKDAGGFDPENIAGIFELDVLDEAEPVAPTPERLSAWLGEYPDHPGLLEALIFLKTGGGKERATVDMIPLLERYADARPVDPMPHRLLAQLYLSGEARAQVGGKDRAIPHLEYLDIREVHSATFAIELARRYADLGEWAKASAKAERAAIIAPFDADVRELAARVAIKADDLNAGERHILALTELEPDRDVHQKRLEAVRRMIEG